MGSSLPNIGTPEANIGTSLSDIGTSEPNIGSSQPNMESSELNMECLPPNIGSLSSNMESSGVNMESLHVNMESPETNMESSSKGRYSRMPFDQMRLLVLEYCCVWRSLDEIAHYTGRNKKYLINFIIPRLGSELQRQFPSSKKHPNQRYRRLGSSEEETEEQLPPSTQLHKR